MSVVSPSVSKSPRLHISHLIVGAGIVLLLVTGLIHLLDAPDSYSEAAYKGMMFIGNGLLAAAAAVGVYQQKRWGWWLGLLTTGGAVVMYVVSRTLGLPGLGVDDAWFEPMGVLSILIEVSFVGLMLMQLRRLLPGSRSA